MVSQAATGRSPVFDDDLTDAFARHPGSGNQFVNKCGRCRQYAGSRGPMETGLQLVGQSVRDQSSESLGQGNPATLNTTFWWAITTPLLPARIRRTTFSWRHRKYRCQPLQPLLGRHLGADARYLSAAGAASAGAELNRFNPYPCHSMPHSANALLWNARLLLLVERATAAKMRMPVHGTRNCPVIRWSRWRTMSGKCAALIAGCCFALVRQDRCRWWSMPFPGVERWRRPIGRNCEPAAVELRRSQPVSISSVTTPSVCVARIVVWLSSAFAPPNRSRATGSRRYHQLVFSTSWLLPADGLPCPGSIAMRWASSGSDPRGRQRRRSVIGVHMRSRRRSITVRLETGRRQPGA